MSEYFNSFVDQLLPPRELLQHQPLQNTNSTLICDSIRCSHVSLILDINLGQWLEVRADDFSTLFCEDKCNGTTNPRSDFVSQTAGVRFDCGDHIP
jgi:hypothetical protein